MEFEYKGKTVQVLPPIKRYVNAVERKLRLPWKMRARVMSDFSTSLCARQEAGESWEDIMASLGTPDAVAAELNAQMADYNYRKSPWRFVFLGLAILCAIWAVWYGRIWIMQRSWNWNPSAIGVIGGADGPTAIFVTAGVVRWTHILTAVALFVAGLFGFWKLGRCKPKRNDKHKGDQ